MSRRVRSKLDPVNNVRRVETHGLDLGKGGEDVVFVEELADVSVGAGGAGVGGGGGGLLLLVGVLHADRVLH